MAFLAYRTQYKLVKFMVFYCCWFYVCRVYGADVVCLCTLHRKQKKAKNSISIFSLCGFRSNDWIDHKSILFMFYVCKQPTKNAPVRQTKQKVLMHS